MMASALQRAATPLHLAALRGHVEVVQVLCAQGACLEARLKVGGRRCGGSTVCDAAAEHPL